MIVLKSNVNLKIYYMLTCSGESCRCSFITPYILQLISMIS
jgi:hypothetical protein